MYVFSENIKNLFFFFSNKIFNLKKKNLCILHGQAFIMGCLQWYQALEQDVRGLKSTSTMLDSLLPILLGKYTCTKK